MFGIGGGEVLVVALVALLLFGNEDLPKNMRKMVKAWNNFRGVTNDLQRSWLDVRDQVARDLLTEQQHEQPARSHTTDPEETKHHQENSATTEEPSIAAHAATEVQSDTTETEGESNLLPTVQAAGGSVAQGELNSAPSQELTSPEKSDKSI
ncbi:MAG: hypothetical protein RLZZ488_255 [Pseudomonadota bacterium]|jgi:Sec-independent protein translocase protein TatA